MRRRRQGVSRSINTFDYSGRLPAIEGKPFAYIMPVSQFRHAELRYRKKGTGLYAHVEKGVKRPVCQDTAIALLSDDISIIGVFDGYRAEGEGYSRAMGRAILRLGYERRKDLKEKTDMFNLIRDAVPMTLETLQTSPLPVGGTTAVIAAIMPDGRYLMGGVADSAAYVIGKDDVERLLTYDQVVTSDFVEKPIAPLKLSPAEYANMRNTIMYAINNRGLDENGIETAEGTLQKGMRLILMSDGIAKNLVVGLAENKTVSEVSGCSDLKRIIGSKISIRRTGEAILSRIRQRISRIKNDTFNIVVRKDGTSLISQDDDLSIVVFAFD